METLLLLVAPCHECGELFDKTGWDERHTDADGEDVHEGCCTLCDDDNEHCSYCGGTGQDPSDSAWTCTTCDGTGVES